MAARKPQMELGDVFSTIGDSIRQSAYAPNINAYKAHAKQKMFHQAIDKRVRLYIGGNRSGKSTAGIVEDIWWLTKRHPYRSFSDRPVIGRLVSVDFMNGTKKIIIPMLKQWIPPSELRGGNWTDAYDAGDRVLNFDNGSSLELMSYDQDLDKFAGTSRDFIHFDEEPPKDIYTECLMRLIDRKGSCWLTMTPVEGMTWVFDDLYEPGVAGHERIGVIEVGIEENPYIDPAEVRAVMTGLSEDEQVARGEGKFVQIGGLVYKKFDPMIHVIPAMDPKEFNNVAKFEQYMSLDHGFNNPTSVHWHAVNQDNEVITFDEHYERERIIDYHAEVINSRNNAHGRIPDVNVADPAIAQRTGVTGTSIQTEYALRGIGFALGNNDVLTGVAKVNQYLTTIGPSGSPSWRITDNCSNLIKEILRLRWATYQSKKAQQQNNPYDKIHKKDDHACDECRYFFTLMPDLSPVGPVEDTTLPPNIGKSTAVDPNRIKIDPNLTPEALGRMSTTTWTRVDLGEL